MWTRCLLLFCDEGKPDKQKVLHTNAARPWMPIYNPQTETEMGAVCITQLEADTRWSGAVRAGLQHTHGAYAVGITAGRVRQL